MKLEKRPHEWESHDKVKKPDPADFDPTQTIKRKRNHRYTREQRNAMRRGLEQLTNYYTIPDGEDGGGSELAAAGGNKRRGGE